MKRLYLTLSLLSLPLAIAPLANAQTSFDVNLGFGSAFNSATGLGLDNASSINAFGTCSLNSGDTFCQATPKLNGFFLGLGGDLMFTKHLGAGLEVNLQPTQSNYGPLQYRQTFYDFNGIYAPINRKRVALKLEGGIGGARTSFSFAESSCVGTAVCSSATEPVGNSSHFQAHVGVGLQLYVTEHIFVRPQFDYHYVENFTQQFGSNSVPEATLWVGYSFGER
jgi:hypothetical protein